MARPPRIDFPEAIYHVTVRGNGRARIFITEADRTRFLDQLRDNVKTAAVVLHAFVLMRQYAQIRIDRDCRGSSKRPSNAA